jgi:hypothetical protein
LQLLNQAFFDDKRRSHGIFSANLPSSLTVPACSVTKRHRLHSWGEMCA